MTIRSDAPAGFGAPLRARRRPAARSRELTHRVTRPRIGWDRRFRVLMLVVLALVGWIGAKAAISMYAAHQQAAREGAALESLRARHSRLLARKRALAQPATIVRDARQLGMGRAGERSYFIVQRSGN